MRIIIIIISAVFSLFLYRFLDLYLPHGEAFYVWVATFLWLLFGTLYNPKEDEIEHKAPEPFQIYESDEVAEQEERIRNTRLASLKRKKAKSLTK